MNKITFDKNKLSLASSDCFDLVQYIIEDIDYIYEQIINLSNNNVWVGVDADAYISIRQNDRIEYENFFEQFKNLLKNMNNIVERINKSSYNITIDKSIVNNIDCQLDNMKKLINEELHSISNELDQSYSLSNSLAYKYRNYNINNLNDCNNKIKEIIDDQNEINNWIKKSTKYVDSIFEEVKDDVNKTKIDSLNVISSIVKKI